MDLITVRELYKHPDQYMDQEITIGGWVRSLRDSKSFGFIVISDGTYFEPLQAVYHDTLENFQQVSRLSVGTAVIVRVLWWLRLRQSSPLRSRPQKLR